MSFKLDEDDNRYQETLKKRRVADLLSEDFPSDEASLLSNGRISCLVCSYHPIFDTMAMLMVHRDGKKHKHNAEYFTKQKQELEDLKVKRIHEHLSQHGSLPHWAKYQDVEAAKHSLQNATRYEPRMKKSNLKPYSRRPKVDIQTASSSKSDNARVSEQEKPLVDSSAESKPVPTNPRQKLPQTIAEYRTNKILESKMAAAICDRKPYVRKTDRDKNIDPSSKDCSNNCQNATGGVPSPDCDRGMAQFTCNVGSYPEHLKPTIDKTKCKHPKGMSKSNKKRIPSNIPEQSQDVTNEEWKKKNEKYLEARAAGWKQDQHGNWIKDDGAEFDSDEEPPDLP